jgi:hypothetical protein
MGYHVGVHTHGGAMRSRFLLGIPALALAPAATGEEWAWSVEQVPKLVAEQVGAIRGPDRDCVAVGGAGSRALKLLDKSEIAQLEGVTVQAVATIGDPASEMALAMAKTQCGCGLRVYESYGGAYGSTRYGRCMERHGPARVRSESEPPDRGAWSHTTTSLARGSSRAAASRRHDPPSFSELSIEVDGAVGPCARVGVGMPMSAQAGLFLEAYPDEHVAFGGRVYGVLADDFDDTMLYSTQELYLGVGFTDPPIHPWLELGLGHAGPGRRYSGSVGSPHHDYGSSFYVNPSMNLSVTFQERVLWRVGGGYSFTFTTYDPWIFQLFAATSLGTKF